MLEFIKQLNQSVFTTHQLAALSKKSLSVTTQSLNILKNKGLVFKIYQGVWTDIELKNLSPYSVVPFIFPTQRAYVSFISALHLYGIIEQIPQTITLASTIHTKIIRTKVGDFFIHRITPLFFAGFNWYKEEGKFLIASPEKALADCLYLSACKNKQFGYFPELHFSKEFDFKRVENWLDIIPQKYIRIYAKKQLVKIKGSSA